MRGKKNEKEHIFKTSIRKREMDLFVFFCFTEFVGASRNIALVG
jgi:hypothetical protein